VPFRKRACRTLPGCHVAEADGPTTAAVAALPTDTPVPPNAAAADDPNIVGRLSDDAETASAPAGSATARTSTGSTGFSGALAGLTDALEAAFGQPELVALLPMLRAGAGLAALTARACAPTGLTAVPVAVVVAGREFPRDAAGAEALPAAEESVAGAMSA